MFQAELVWFKSEISIKIKDLSDLDTYFQTVLNYFSWNLRIALCHNAQTHKQTGIIIEIMDNSVILFWIEAVSISGH